MENATKALIIAGAILIAILLISVGVMIMNSTSGVTGQMTESMDSTAISSYNSNFTNYAGTQKGSTIKSLVSIAISTNAASDSYTVKINGVDPSTIKTSSISSTGTYTVDFTYTSGLITNITITPGTGVSAIQYTS